MERTYIKDITPGRRKISGFVENFRNKRTMAFIVVKDVTGKLQVTVEKEKHPEMIEMLDSLTIHSVVTFEGEVLKNDYVKLGGIEMLPDLMKVESVAEALPIKDIRLSLMSQYTPKFALECEYKELHRRVTSFEYRSVLERAVSLGFLGYFQERSSASEDYTPDFSQNDLLFAL